MYVTLMKKYRYDGISEQIFFNRIIISSLRAIVSPKHPIILSQTK